MSMLSSIQKLLHTPRVVFHAFAENHDLVYFGKLHQDDEHHIVRGITVSTAHVDEHYCVGTAHTYDLIALQRTDTLALPNTNHSEKYSWIIMQLDLHSTYDHPHVFLDGGHHNEAFYQTLFVKFARLMKVDKSVISESSQSFAERFTAYTPPDSLDEIPEFLEKTVADNLAQKFAHLDFEWFQDRLLIYSTGRPASKHLLEHMLRAGLWLAEELDEFGKQKISAHHGADIPEPSTN
jgi:hypothetical protein